MSVRFHPAADAELAEGLEWYLDRSYAAAEGFAPDIEHALAHIGEAPEWYPRTRPGARRLLNYLTTWCTA